MGKRQDRDIYKIRTLSFYQKVGGVFNDLITVLTKLRSDSNVRLSMPPAKVLNVACRIFDDLSDSHEEGLTRSLDYWWETLGREGNIERLVIFSTMYILSTDLPDAHPRLSVELERRLGNEKIVFPLFDAIPHPHRSMPYAPHLGEVEGELKDLRKQIEEKDNEIKQLKEAKYDDAAVYFEVENNALKEKYELLARESRQKEVDYKAQIADLEELCRNKDYEISRLTTKKVIKPKTEADEALGLDNIMAYIESRGSYDNCIQLFTMLDKLVRRIVTDEQLSQIDDLEARMIAMSKGVTINNNIHDNTGDIMPGTVNMNK